MIFTFLFPLINKTVAFTKVNATVLSVFNKNQAKAKPLPKQRFSFIYLFPPLVAVVSQRYTGGHTEEEVVGVIGNIVGCFLLPLGPAKTLGIAV